MSRWSRWVGDVADIETPASGLSAGPIRGEVRVETNVPEHAVIAIPVDGTALK